MRLGKDPKVDLIGKVPLFSHCSRKELEQVASIADEINLADGKQLTQEGDPGSEFFVLLDGTAEVTRGGREIAKVGPGDFFGEMALVSDLARTATVTATSPVRMLVVTGRDFRMLLEGSTELQAKIFRAVSDRLARLLEESG